MRRSIRKIFAVSFAATVMLMSAACAKRITRPEPDRTVDNVPITSEWTVDSWTLHGDTTIASEFSDPERIPVFETEDGETFRLSITGEKYYEGTIVTNEDGTYSLVQEGSDNAVEVVIEGNVLTLNITDDTQLVFVAQE